MQGGENQMPTRLLDDSLNTYPFLFPGEADYFIKLLQKLPNSPRILEIGTFRGLSSILFAKTRKDAKIITIDNHRGIKRDNGDLLSSYEKVLNNFKLAGVSNVTHIQVSSQDYKPEGKFDLLFIDGDHSYKAASFDYKKYSPFVKEGGLVIFHDYSTFKGVRLVCNSIQTHGNKIRFKSLIIIKKCTRY